MVKITIDFLESYDNKSNLEELKRIALITGKDTVTKVDMKAHGRVSYALINRRFASLRKAIEQAGLRPQRYMKATE